MPACWPFGGLRGARCMLRMRTARSPPAAPCSPAKSSRSPVYPGTSRSDLFVISEIQVCSLFLWIWALHNNTTLKGASRQDAIIHLSLTPNAGRLPYLLLVTVAAIGAPWQNAGALVGPSLPLVKHSTCLYQHHVHHTILSPCLQDGRASAARQHRRKRLQQHQ